MTQATQPAPSTPAAAAIAAPVATPTAAAPGSPGAGTGARTGKSRPGLDVPALLNRWQVAAVTACVLFGVLTALLQVLSWNANRLAADNTEQLQRVQAIQSELLNADALATTAFLIGGLEPPGQRAAYDAAIGDVGRLVADAARAQPADREALAALNQAVTTYATTITQARVNNRQGFPVGAAYLGEASTGLREQALPVVAALVEANTERAEDEMGAQRPWLVVLPGLAVLLALWWVNRRLAATFRRRFNVGVGAAFVAVALTTLLALAVSVSQRSQNSSLVDDEFTDSINLATARSAGNDARANEALRLINRGSGAAFEDAYVGAAATVRDRLTTTTVEESFDRYDAQHQQVVELDDAGQWDQAVALATSDEVLATFEQFDDGAQRTAEGRAQSTATILRRGNGAVLGLAGGSLLVGLLAAGACTWGIAARRREYA